MHSEHVNKKASKFVVSHGQKGGTRGVIEYLGGGGRRY
jgi:hypothetical protein